MPHNDRESIDLFFPLCTTSHRIPFEMQILHFIFKAVSYRNCTCRTPSANFTCLEKHVELGNHHQEGNVDFFT